ncbi:MAG: hypothetical protein J6T39_02800, partial [Clostridia bacterium]|nr:hypothetical protein [Clostridia bacterium]
QSNLFVGLAALVFAVFEILLLRGKKEIPKAMQIIKFAATSAVALTFFIVFAYLGFIVKGGVVVLLANSNMFFHLIVPVLAIIVFVLFERTNVIRFRDATWGVVPAVLYAVFYMTNVLVHLKNGQVDHKYDFYYFVQGGLWQIAIVVPLVLGIAYGIGVLLWVANRRGKNKNGVE